MTVVRLLVLAPTCLVAPPPQAIPDEERDHGERHRGDGDPGAAHGAARAPPKPARSRSQAASRASTTTR